MREADVVVIGAGQAGITAGHHLLRHGFAPAEQAPVRRASQEQGVPRTLIMLDAEDGPGGAWRHRWDSLTLGTVNGITELPDQVLDAVDPEAPAALAVPAYFAAFERRRDLPIERPVEVVSVQEEHPGAGPEGALVLRSRRGGSGPGAGEELAPIRARAIINATGTWRRPFVPHLPGAATFAGRQLRTVDYPGAQDLVGARVAVVGGGISATGFLAEISAAAAAVGAAQPRWYTRREPDFREGPFTPEVQGRAAVAAVEERVRQGLPPRSVVSVTGLPWTPALRAAQSRGALRRRPMFSRIVPEGVIEADGTLVPTDVILWATGFRADLGHLAPLRLRGAGGGIRMEGTQVAGEPRVHLVGYGPSSSTIGANRAGRAAAAALARRLEDAPGHIGPRLSMR